jgi:hypothetical protein
MSFFLRAFLTLITAQHPAPTDRYVSTNHPYVLGPLGDMVGEEVEDAVR